MITIKSIIEITITITISDKAPRKITPPTKMERQRKPKGNGGVRKRKITRKKETEKEK